MPSCYHIYDYWKDKGILENGEISDVHGLAVVQNEHLPSCWACGMPVNRRDILSWDKYDHDPKELWSAKKVNSKLQRCHILAKQFGGEAVPENLFLLCEDCHAASPDTKNRAAFFRWVYRKRQEAKYGIHFKKMLQEGAAEIQSRGYEPRQFLCMLDRDEIPAIVEEGMTECGLHGMGIAESSAVICIVDAMERRILEKRAREVRYNT